MFSRNMYKILNNPIWPADRYISTSLVNKTFYKQDYEFETVYIITSFVLAFV